jgi:transcription elongation GreA/GreB family factor
MEEKLNAIKRRIKILEQYKQRLEKSNYLYKKEKLADTETRISELEFVIQLLED